MPCRRFIHPRLLVHRWDTCGCQNCFLLNDPLFCPRLAVFSCVCDDPLTSLVLCMEKLTQGTGSRRANYHLLRSESETSYNTSIPQAGKECYIVRELHTCIYTLRIIKQAKLSHLQLYIGVYIGLDLKRTSSIQRICSQSVTVVLCSNGQVSFQLAV